MEERAENRQGCMCVCEELVRITDFQGSEGPRGEVLVQPILQMRKTRPAVVALLVDGTARLGSNV